MVAESFIYTDNYSLHVNHKDFNTINNNVINLEWCTNKENAYHSINNGRFQMVADESLRKRSINKKIKKGSLNGCSKLNEKQVIEIRVKFIPNVYTRRMLADEYSVKESTIKDILYRKSWKHV